MKPVDLEAMIALAERADAPAMLCQAGFVFVNTESISRHPELREQLARRLQNHLLKKLEACSNSRVEVYSMVTPESPADRIHRQERAKLFQLNR